MGSSFLLSFYSSCSHLQHLGLLICQEEQSQIGVTFWYLQNIRWTKWELFSRGLSHLLTNRVSIVVLHSFLKSGGGKKKRATHPASVQSMKQWVEEGV